MADYYINPSWTGPFNGTLSQPYANYSSVPSLIAGDNVFFARGTIHVGQIVYDAARGASTTLASPITFGAYGTGAPPLITAGDGFYCVDVIARNGVIIQDLEFGAISKKCAGGVRVLNSGQSIVRRNVCRPQCDYGVRIDNTTATLLSTVSVLNNTILGTFSNSAILLIWGSAEGGIYEDVIIQNNNIKDSGILDLGLPVNGPYGIRCIPRTTPVTTSSGTVELNLFVRGLQVIGNTIINTKAGGLWTSSISSGGTSTLVNRISNNSLINIGNGVYDSHALWVGGCRDMFVEGNTVDGTIMAQGVASGTGVGIFLDNTGFGTGQAFDICRRVYVRNNTVRNTGKKPEGTLNKQLEIAGAGIFSYFAQNCEIVDNQVENCYNGIGVYGWDRVNGAQGNNVLVRGNRILNSVKTGISVIANSNNTFVIENYIDGYGESGFYLENSGAGTPLNYTETRNGVVGTLPTTYQGGSSPTSSTTPVAPRTPSAGNLVLSPTYY